MLLQMQESIAGDYKSNSQKIRVLSEHWLKQYGYCVSCGNVLEQYENNKPVADFYCPSCTEDYELKSSSGSSQKIVDGAYSTMIAKIEQNELPNFFYMNYEKQSLKVSNLIVIPKHFFTKELIEQRKPLAITAKRAGWVGCNINLAPIPKSGKLYLVKHNAVVEKQSVIKEFNKTRFLRKPTSLEARGWTLEIMNCLDKLQQTKFDLADVYQFEAVLSVRFPKNNNVRAKIRQQLQILRDNHYLEFLGRGKYQLT
jgi:type II restriction enzyme